MSAICAPATGRTAARCIFREPGRGGWSGPDLSHRRTLLKGLLANRTLVRAAIEQERWKRVI